MQKFQRVQQHDADAQAFAHRQSPALRQIANRGEVPRLICLAHRLPRWVQRVAEFHDVVKVTGLVIAVDVINVQQAGMLVGKAACSF